MTTATFVVLNSLLVGITLILAFADYLFGGEGQVLIRVNKDKLLPSSSGSTLLEALAEKEIFIPSACGGKGSCGHCKVQVESGGGEILPTEEGLLSTAEKRNNIRIACQLRLREEIAINVPEDLLEVAEYKAEVIGIEDLNGLDRRVQLRMISPEKFHFQAGQYIQIMIPGYEEFRAYSIASTAERDDGLDLMIRRVHKGLSTTFIHKALQVGDIITLTGPYGNELIVAEDVEKAILVGGGIGIAPFASVVEDVVKRENMKDVKLIYGVNLENQFIKDERFKELERKYANFEYIKVVAFDDNWQGEKGFVTDVLKKLDLTDYKVYMCGPPPMINASISVLNELGVADEDIFYETQ